MTIQHKYPIADGHADILYRMVGEKLDFWSEESLLQMSFHDQQLGGVQLQAYAIFPEPRHSAPAQLREVLQCIDVYREQILAKGIIVPVESRADLEKVGVQALKGALLTLEGAHCLNEDLSILRTLFRLGIRSVGLTWNFQNSLGYGVRESKDFGLTEFGKECVREMQRIGILVDVAHLAPKGVEQILSDASAPVICSHGNAYSVFPHVRNLRDDQIRGIAATGGYVGVTFVPYFIADGPEVTIQHLLRHVDYLLNLVGDDHVALGSDFDGIQETMIDLDRGRKYPLLISELERRYGSQATAKIAYGNVFRVLSETLPPN